MTIYLDIVLIISTYCHWIILQLTNQLVRLQTKWYRILLGSVVASSIIPIALYFPHSIFSSMISLVLLSIITIICTFGFRHIRFIGKIVLTFYFVTFIIGGGLLAVYFSGLYLNKTVVSNPYDESINGLFVLIGVPAIWIFIRYLFKKLENDKLVYDEICHVTLEFNGQVFDTKGFIDSGNQLVDPISRRPVAVCDAMLMKKFFSYHHWNLLKDALKENNVDPLPDHLKKQLYIVPFHTVDGNSNMIYTFKPERLTIEYEHKKITMNKVLIGINWTHLTTDRSYECLLHPEMVHASKVNIA